MFIDDLIHLAAQKENTRQFSRLMKEAVVVKIQNVADYVTESPTEKWDKDKDFPNIAPPFGVLWLEWMHPATWGFRGERPPFVPDRFPIGVLLISFDNQLGSFPPDFQSAAERSTPDLRWITNGHFFWNVGRGVESPSQLAWGVSGEGEIRTFGGDLLASSNAFSQSLPQLSTKKMEEGSDPQILLPIVYMALSFMHCKNVQVVKGPAWDQKLQVARAKRGKLPLVRWNTIVIDPVKRVIAAANNGNSALTPRALHICRGHFKDFTKHGLFGRYHDRYWWPMQTRGSAQNGVVNKDYLVKAGTP